MPLFLKPWKGKPGDKGLIEFIPFLKFISIYKPPDMRAILKAYESKHITLKYAEKEAESKRAFIEEWKAWGGGKGLSHGSFTVSSLFSSNSEKVSTLGVLPVTFLRDVVIRLGFGTVQRVREEACLDMSPRAPMLLGSGTERADFVSVAELFGHLASHVSPLPLMYLEAKHHEAQNFYQEEQKYICEHKGKFDALIEANHQAQVNALSGPLWAGVAATAQRRRSPATYSR
ncbi:hypothetical protein EDB86DRAFT_3075809 [Lactarius hatsudake]|nr:hypothetical protein EDB86DRAFT_3075809 [Lactarius hatsudake]